MGRTDVLELVEVVATQMQQAGLAPGVMRVGVEEEGGRVYVDVIDRATLVPLGRVYSHADSAAILAAGRLLLEAAAAGPECHSSWTA